MKKLILSLCLIAAITASFTACQKEEKAAGGNTSVGSVSSAQTKNELAEMDKKTYLEKIESLNTAASKFAENTVDFSSMALQNPDDTEKIKTSIEKIRETKQAFLDFSAIENPPKQYADIHKEMSQHTKDFGGQVDEYCDLLLTPFNEDEADDKDYNTKSEDILKRIETTMTKIGDQMTAVENVK